MSTLRVPGRTCPVPGGAPCRVPRSTRVGHEADRRPTRGTPAPSSPVRRTGSSLRPESVSTVLSSSPLCLRLDSRGLVSPLHPSSFVSDVLLRPYPCPSLSPDCPLPGSLPSPLPLSFFGLHLPPLLVNRALGTTSARRRRGTTGQRRCRHGRRRSYGHQGDARPPGWVGSGREVPRPSPSGRGVVVGTRRRADTVTGTSARPGHGRLLRLAFSLEGRVEVGTCLVPGTHTLHVHRHTSGPHEFSSSCHTPSLRWNDRPSLDHRGRVETRLVSQRTPSPKSRRVVPWLPDVVSLRHPSGTCTLDPRPGSRAGVTAGGATVSVNDPSRGGAVVLLSRPPSPCPVDSSLHQVPVGPGGSSSPRPSPLSTDADHGLAGRRSKELSSVRTWSWSSPVSPRGLSVRPPSLLFRPETGTTECLRRSERRQRGPRTRGRRPTQGGRWRLRRRPTLYLRPNPSLCPVLCRSCVLCPVSSRRGFAVPAPVADRPSSQISTGHGAS